MGCGTNAGKAELQTERLDFEPVSPSHGELLVGLDSDSEVMRYLTGGRPSSSEEVREHIQRALGHRWILRIRSDATFIGWAGLDPTSVGEYELGDRLAQQFWGQGLATEASRRLVDHAFVDLAGTRVRAQTMAVNVRSRSVLERCGFRYRRTFHLDWDDPIPGTERGEVEYEIRRPDWAARP